MAAEPAIAGGSAVARFTGSRPQFCCLPGACAPGFMLSPATRAKCKPATRAKSKPASQAKNSGTNMQRKFEIDEGFIAEQNQKLEPWIYEDYEHLAKVLRRRQIDIEDLVTKAQSFR